MNLDQYRILNEINERTNGLLGCMLNSRDMCSYTVCPVCGVDDFTHVEGCPEIPK